MILYGLSGLFVWFALKTYARQRLALLADDHGLRAHGFHRRALRWEDVEDVRLAYYAPRRGGKPGWMHLKVKGGGAVIRADSELEGFERLLDRVAAAVATNRLELGPTSAANFAAVGLAIPAPPKSG